MPCRMPEGTTVAAFCPVRHHRRAPRPAINPKAHRHDSARRPPRLEAARTRQPQRRRPPGDRRPMRPPPVACCRQAPTTQGSAATTVTTDSARPHCPQAPPTRGIRRSPGTRRVAQRLPRRYPGGPPTLPRPVQPRSGATPRMRQAGASTPARLTQQTGPQPHRGPPMGRPCFGPSTDAAPSLSRSEIRTLGDPAAPRC